MKVLVTYWTQTGNTRKIAQAIFDVLSCNKELKPFEEVDTLEGYDLIFAGFPVMQFGPAAAARTFFQTMASGKKIALFVTHAMPVEGDDPRQQDMLEKELEKCRRLCINADLTGFFHCQGELSEKLANELRGSNIPMLTEFAAMQPSTKGHPTAEEVDMARAFAREMIGKI